MVRVWRARTRDVWPNCGSCWHRFCSVLQNGNTTVATRYVWHCHRRCQSYCLPFSRKTSSFAFTVFMHKCRETNVRHVLKAVTVYSLMSSGWTETSGIGTKCGTQQTTVIVRNTCFLLSRRWWFMLSTWHIWPELIFRRAYGRIAGGNSDGNVQILPHIPDVLHTHLVERDGNWFLCPESALEICKPVECDWKTCSSKQMLFAERIPCAQKQARKPWNAPDS